MARPASLSTANPVPASPITVKIGVSQSGDSGAMGAATETVSGATTSYTIATSNDNADEADDGEVPALTNISRFRGTVSRAQYWAAGLAVVVIFFGSWALVRMVGSATGSEWLALAIAVPILLALIYAVTALTVARLRHLGASLWWMVAWPLTAPVFWGIVGLLTIEASTEMKTLLACRSHVSRGQFWTVGGWLLFVWVVWFYVALFLGLAGGWFPTVLMYAWFTFTPFALYAWTALVVGRLRHLRASLWWVALWPLTAPVFWLVVGVLPAHQAETAGAISPKRGAPVAAILLAICIGALAIFLLFLSTA